jgi:hypothetical protein
MPYIPPEARKRVEVMGPCRVGELTYKLYADCMEYLGYGSTTPYGYARFAEIIAALETTKLELYRRHVAGYEDIKLEENGDI